MTNCRAVCAVCVKISPVRFVYAAAGAAKAFLTCLLKSFLVIIWISCTR